MKFLNTDSVRSALAEIVIIALGVGVAIAADSWNERRQERELEQEFLAGLALDMELNYQRLQSNKRQAGDLLISLERMIAAIETDERHWDSPESFVVDLVHCTYLGIPDLTSITFDELQSTGSMRLLRDQEFKRSLAEYYMVFEIASQFHPEYRRKEAALEEALLGLLPLDERLEINEAGKTSATDVDIDEWLEEMRSRPELVARLEDMVWVQHRMLTRYDYFETQAQEMLEQIEGMRR